MKSGVVEKVYYGSERREMLEFLPERCDRLLDVGCGWGGFGSAVLKLRPHSEVWGVEIDEKAAEIAKSRLSRVVHAPFTRDLDLPDDYFDVVTFNDSLEHLPDEEEALAIAVSKLRPGGRIVCSVPNVRYLENLRSLLIDADWEYVNSGILDRTHLRFFTKKSLLRALGRSGLQVERVEGLNSHHWSGWKIGMLRFFLGKWVEDTRWMRYAVVARKTPTAYGG